MWTLQWGIYELYLACEKPEIFKAIGNVAGTMSGFTWNNCSPTSPVPVLHIHGEADRTVPIDGSISSPGGWAGAPHVDSIFRTWSIRNDCKSTDTVKISDNTTAYYSKGGKNGNEVWYYKIAKHGHSWPVASDQSGIIASKVIWDFFRNYKTPVGDVSSIELQKVMSYPNPSTGFVNLQNFEAGSKVYKLFSSTGMLIEKGEIPSSGKLEFNLIDKPNGVYYLSVENQFHKLILRKE